MPEKQVEIGIRGEIPTVKTLKSFGIELLNQGEIEGRLVAREKEQWAVIKLPVSLAKTMASQRQVFEATEVDGKGWQITGQFPLAPSSIN